MKRRPTKVEKDLRQLLEKEREFNASFENALRAQLKKAKEDLAARTTEEQLKVLSAYGQLLRTFSEVAAPLTAFLNDGGWQRQ